MTMRRILAPLLLLVATGPQQGGGWELIAPRNAHRSGTLESGMAEASGAAVSRRNAGIVWTINDSGNPPDLIATDTLGRLRAVLSLAGATNQDWEEVALGRCGGNSCVYIADTGDNRETRSDVVLYRLPEPVLATATTGTIRDRITGVESLHFVYPDGPHDVEAMAVTAGGDVLLVTKGRSHGVIEFRIPARAWEVRGTVTATRIDSLPIHASGSSGQLITGMAISPDGKRAVVRSYRELFPFALRADGTMRPLGKPTSCDVLGLEPQGEGIAFLDDRRLVLTSERGLFKAGTVFVVECPVQ
jgi:hypothetical protein